MRPRRLGPVRGGGVQLVLMPVRPQVPAQVRRDQPPPGRARNPTHHALTPGPATRSDCPHTHTCQWYGNTRPRGRRRVRVAVVEPGRLQQRRQLVTTVDHILRTRRRLSWRPRHRNAPTAAQSNPNRPSPTRRATLPAKPLYVRDKPVVIESPNVALAATNAVRVDSNMRHGRSPHPAEQYDHNDHNGETSGLSETSS